MAIAEESGSDAEPAAVARRLRRRAERERRRQVGTAREHLDDRHHDAVETVAERLTERVLARPRAALALAEQTENEELARALATLFDPEEA